MSNPYLDDSGDTRPAPRKQARDWLWIVAIGLGTLGCFLPAVDGCNGWSLPIPIVDPVVDPVATEGSWVVVVEQTERRTPEITKVLNDTKFWSSIEDRGLKWRFYDYDADDSQAYRALADKTGMPAVVIVGGNGEILGKVLDSFVLPTSVSEIDAKIRKATGR